MRILGRLRARFRRWQALALVGGGALWSEVGARIGLPGVSGDRIGTFLEGTQWGPLRLYDVLAGGGLARGAMLALGIIPYVQARCYLWLARAVSPRVRRAMAGRRHAVTLGLTGVVATVQSLGFARFLPSVSGAVLEPGLGFVVQTVVLLTGGSLLLGWFAEGLRGADDDERTEPLPSVAIEERGGAPGVRGAPDRRVLGEGGMAEQSVRQPRVSVKHPC